MQLPSGLLAWDARGGWNTNHPVVRKSDRIQQPLVDALTAPDKGSANSSHQLPDMSEASTDDSSPQLMLNTAETSFPAKSCLRGKFMSKYCSKPLCLGIVCY